MTSALAELEKHKAELKKAPQEVKQHEATTVEAEKSRPRVLVVEETLKGVSEAHNKLQTEGQRTKEEL